MRSSQDTRALRPLIDELYAKSAGGGGASGLSSFGASSQFQSVPVDPNTFVPASLGDPAWTFAGPTFAPKIQLFDQAANGFADGVLVNPYADAPGGGFLQYILTAPPGASSLVLTATASLSATLGDPPATVVIQVYDSTGLTLLGSTTCVLTATPTDYSVAAPVTPGSQFRVVVVTNNPGLGTSVQPQWECFGVAVTFPGATGFLGAAFNRLHVNAGAYSENEEKFNVNSFGWRASSHATVNVDTSADEIVIEYVSTIFPGAAHPQALGMAVFVNARLLTTIAPFSGEPEYATIDLPPGLKRVTIVSDQVSGPGSNQSGTYPRAVYAPRRSILAHVRDDSSPRRMVVYGDSIADGGLAFPTCSRGWVPRVRQVYPGRITVEAWGGRTLFEDAGPAGSAATNILPLARKIAATGPSDIWPEIGMNDWALATYTAANFGTAYAAMLDAFHAANPGALIECQSPTINGNEAFANANSEFLRDFREQIRAAALARPFCLLTYGASYYPASDLFPGDAFHGDTTANDKYARAVVSVLGLADTPAPAPAVNPTNLASMTPYEYWESDHGVTVVAGSVTSWAGVLHGFSLDGAPGTEPTLVAGALNGFPSINSDGTQFLLQTTPEPLSTPLSFCVVVKANVPAQPPGSHDVLLNSVAGLLNVIVGSQNNPRTFAFAAGAELDNPNALSSTAWNILFCVLDGATSRVDVFTVGNPAPTTVIATGATGATPIAVNGWQLFGLLGGTRMLNGQVVALYTWDSIATLTDENAFVEGYLKPKYVL